MQTQNKSVPVSAMRFTVGEFNLGDNGENAKTAPIKMVARSGQPIDHWYWGKVAHDMAGLKLHKERIALDYNHNPDEIIGYANRFDVADGNLNVAGALVPYKESDRATEIIHKSKMGVPYEASIYFDGSDAVIEEIPEGAAAEVNGYSLAGPAVIFRQWNLRGIAVCPHGADRNTSSEFTNNAATVNVAVINQEKKMSDETKEAVAVEATPEQVTPEAASAAAVESVQPEAEAQAVEGAPVALAAPVNEGQKFLDAFGDQGGVWFAQGKSFAEAQQLHVEALAAENARLKAEVEKLSAAQPVARGASPCSFQPAGTSQLTKSEVAKFGSKTAANISRAIRIRK